uniref:Zinc finger protein n=1 Tax=Phallusia mammillata TaxID=59560 RepID=A0A6F9DSS5_9ASCI|nr:zinc finger protein [Phallusia mammillata]
MIASEDIDDDRGIKVSNSLTNNGTINAIYNVDSMKSHCPVSDVTIVPTSVPIYLFASAANDDLDEQFNAPGNLKNKTTESQQMLKSSNDQGPTLNALGSEIDLQMPYYDSTTRTSTISMPVSNISQAVNTSSSTVTVEGTSTTTDLSEEMIRSFVVGGSSLPRRSVQTSIMNDKETYVGETAPPPMVTAIISTSDNEQGSDTEEDNEESEVEKQVIILTEDDGELMVDNCGNPLASEDLLMMNENEDNEILVTLLGTKSETQRQAFPHADLHPVTTYLSAEEILRHQPVLDMNFEVVKEIVNDKGKNRREVMTQTKPLRRPRNIRKRKANELEDGDDMSENQSPEFGREAGKPGKSRKCPRCNLRFYDPEILRIHMNCHTILDKEFKCYQCNFTAQHWVKMYHHLFTHGVEKPHKCPQCVFSCINKSDLTAHMFVHSKTKDWLCNKCARLFKHRRNMVAHCRVCPGVDSAGNVKKVDGVTKYICNVCNKQLSNKRNLDKHMEIHSDVKPFVCDMCGHSTRLKESLIMHKRLHTGEKPFKCDQCEYSTPDKSSLRRHKRRHTNEKPHCCPFCEYKSIQKHCLDTHVRRKHTGEQFVCGLCHYTTPDRYALNQHFKQHQPGVVSNIDQPTAIVNICGNVLTTMHDEQQTPENDEKTKVAVSSQEDIVFRFERVDSESKEKNDQVIVTQTSEPQDASHKTDNQLHIITSPAVPSEQISEEPKVLAIGSPEDLLLQQIQEPGDLVLIQESGEILIKKQDGRILVIQQEEDWAETQKS